jgi:glycerol-3-phosphate dehydrogenase
MEPALAAAPLAGACAYEDCRVDEPERAVFALIADAGLHGALALNHAACAGLEIKDGRVEALLIEDQLTGETFPASARAIVNAAGAAADSVASMLLPGQKSVRITRSKGVHFVTRPIVRRAALALGDTKRHAFVIPWKGFTLIGTSDVQIAESTASAGPSDLAELESRVRDLMPGLGALDVLDGYAGVRSLPGQAGSTYKAARDIAFADHADEGAAGLFAIFGGKWTTARLMAERAVDAIVRQLGRSAAPCDTTRRPLACTPDSPADFVRSWRARLPSWPEAEIAVWAGAYGRDFGRVLSPIADADGLDADAREAARFAYAVESEMAVTAEDVSRRLARWSSIARPGLEERAAAFLARPKVSGG